MPRLKSIQSDSLKTKIFGEEPIKEVRYRGGNYRLWILSANSVIQNHSSNVKVFVEDSVLTLTPQTDSLN